MPFHLMTLSRVAMPVSRTEGLKILDRDQFRLQILRIGWEGQL
jgi:hypothetical protein